MRLTSLLVAATGLGAGLATPPAIAGGSPDGAYLAPFPSYYGGYGHWRPWERPICSEYVAPAPHCVYAPYGGRGHWRPWQRPIWLPVAPYGVRG